MIVSGDGQSLLLHVTKQVVLKSIPGGFNGVLRQIKATDALGRDWVVGYRDVEPYVPPATMIEFLVEKHVFGNDVAWTHGPHTIAIPLRIDATATKPLLGSTQTILAMGHWDVDIINNQQVYGYEVLPYARHIAYAYKIFQKVKGSWTDNQLTQYDAALGECIGRRERWPFLANLLPVDICEAALRVLAVDIYDIALYHPLLTQPVKLAHQDR